MTKNKLPFFSNRCIKLFFTFDKWLKLVCSFQEIYKWALYGATSLAMLSKKLFIFFKTFIIILLFF